METQHEPGRGEAGEQEGKVREPAPGDAKPRSDPEGRPRDRRERSL